MLNSKPSRTSSSCWAWSVVLLSIWCMLLSNVCISAWVRGTAPLFWYPSSVAWFAYPFSMLFTCMLCIGLPCWVVVSQSPVRPSSSSSVARCDLTPDRLLGAAMSSPAVVPDPAWLGSQCCVKYTSRSSGVAVSNVLLHVAWAACSQSANSLTAVVLAFLVLSFTDFCCRLAASVKPLLYRSRHC